MINKRTQAFIPLVFWLVIIAIKLIGVLPMYVGEVLSSRLETIVITTSLEILTFLYFYYLIIPNLLRKNRLVLNIGLALLFWCLFGIVWSLVYRYAGRTETFEESIIIYKASLGHTLLSTLYAVGLRLSVDWINKYQRQQELEKQNVKTELALLRSQVNPHFLFNTLNNIHSFSIHDPEKTSFAIIKLSEIMRYMLYEASGEKVLLENEINYINNFIALQKLRYKERDFVKFTIDGDTSNLFIPPLIFLPFIENAFKYGTSSVPNAIEIFIQVGENQIYFRCVNQMKQLNDTEKNRPGGLGIQNIKRRLELLLPLRHSLNMTMKNNVYFVELNLQLDAY